MQFWVLLLASNAWALLVLVQGLLAKDKERLTWLRRRAAACALMSLIGAALAIGFVVWAMSKGADRSLGMPLILKALLLMLLPLLARTIVNERYRRVSA